MRHAVALASAVLLLAAPASAQARPDLTVASGTATIRGTTLTATVTVAVRGGRAPATTTTLRAGSRILARVRTRALRAGTRTRLRITRRAIALPPGTYALRACADARGILRERSERDNCRRIGTATITAASTPTAPGSTPTTPGTTPAPSPTTGDPAPLSAPDTTYTADKPFLEDGSWLFVPADYDRSHATPTKLLVWLHGCGGRSEDDINTVADYWDDATYLAMAPIGPEDANQCWQLDAADDAVMAAIARTASHFNVDPRRIVIGGYSSGGDLAYRTAFINAKRFAGVLAMNTSPFRDTGLTQAQALGAATWRFPVRHVLHTGDTTYPIAGVKQELQAMTDAGHAVTTVQRPGEHYDQNTDKDIQDVLVHTGMKLAWQAPSR